MSLLIILLPLLSQLPTLIQEAEKAFSGKPGSGAAKKQLVMDTVDTALTVLHQTGHANIPADHHALILSHTSSLVENIVKAVNDVEALAKPNPDTSDRVAPQAS